jgi:hypothetical protein
MHESVAKSLRTRLQETPRYVHHRHDKQNSFGLPTIPILTGLTGVASTPCIRDQLHDLPRCGPAITAHSSMDLRIRNSNSNSKFNLTQHDDLDRPRLLRLVLGNGVIDRP